MLMYLRAAAVRHVLTRNFAGTSLALAACIWFGNSTAQERTPGTTKPDAIDQRTPPSANPTVPSQKVWVVQVVVNGRRFGINLGLEQDGKWWLPEKGSDAWGLTTRRNTPTIRYRGQSFVPVEAFGAHAVQFDESALVLNITFDASAFAGSGDQRMSGNNDFVTPTQQATGGFINYDLLFTSVSQRGTRNALEAGAELELGAFSPLGSVIGSFKVAKPPPDQSTTRMSTIIRNYTTYRMDWPEKILTLEVGDSIGKSGIWGRPVLFGGLNFHTNFSTRPGFITYPQPTFSGAAAVPSTATVFIDNVRRANLGFPPGPFGVSNIPVFSGSNEISLVVRDSLGRETVMRQQFYASLDLLKPGLHDFAVETGFIRQNFGLRSFDYEQLVVVGQSRYGWNEKVTTEARIEQVGRGTTVGLGAIVLVPIPAIATLAAAASHVDGRSGSLILAGIEKRERDWAVGVRGQWSSGSFIQLGIDQTRTGAHRNYTAYASSKLGRNGEYGGVAVAYADAGRGPTDGGKTVTATWTKSLLHGATFNLIAAFANQPIRSTQISALLRYPLGPRLSMSADVSRSSSGATSASLGAATSLNNVQETAWRARVSATTAPGTSGNVAGETTVMWRAPSFDTSAGLSVNRQAQAGRLAFSGAVGMADGTWFISRSLHDGFGVIRTPGMTGIPITANGRVVAVSDGNGVAIIPRLIPFEQNPLRVDLKRLPLNVDTDDDKVVLVPAFRSAATGEIRLFRFVSAMMTVKTSDGKPIPLGTEVNLIGSSERFVVGRAGRLYLSRLQQKNEIVINLESGDCKFSLEIPEENFSPLVDGNRRLQLGNQVCK